MFVQVGAFGERANAERLAERLRAEGFANTTVASQSEGRRLLHRVRVGPLASSYEFDEVRVRLDRLGVAGAHLVVDR
jgi:rare lipoprotein A